MSYNTILGDSDFLEFLRGKKATFLLALSNTKTYEIEGISQAGIPNKLHLTPALDAEFVCTGQVRSLNGIAETSKGVPTPALMTRMVHLLHPFSNIEILNLGLEVSPAINYFKQHTFDLQPSESIDKGAGINAMEIFQKAVEFGKNYECQDDYLILAESVPAGTTTAQATALALGYDVKDKFSSSYKIKPDSIKDQTIQKALSHLDDSMDIFEKLGLVSDNMIIFNAGFLLGLTSTSTKVILAGGTQMASVLLVVNAIVKEMQGVFNSNNIALCTTKWVYADQASDIEGILKLLDFPVNAFYSDFDFSTSSHGALKLYDDGEAKEGVGAGAALCYALLNGVESSQIIKKLEALLS